MSDDFAAKVALCPDCGAQNQPDVTRCWLCGRALEPAIVMAELVDEQPPGRGRVSFTPMSVMAVVTLIAIALGLGDVAPGLSGLLLLVAVPAVMITAVRAGRRRSVGREMTWSEKIVSFLLSAAIVVGTLVMLSVAAFVAFFVWCLVALSRGGL